MTIPNHAPPVVAFPPPPPPPPPIAMSLMTRAISSLCLPSSAFPLALLLSCSSCQYPATKSSTDASIAAKNASIPLPVREETPADFRLQ